MGILPQAREYREAGGQLALEDQMPDAWIDQLAIVGTAVDWKLAIENVVEQGVQTIVLVPLPDTSPDEINIFSLQLGEFKSI